MENKIPFTSYDFWAYLSAGFLLIFAVDDAAGLGLLGRTSWTVVQGVTVVAGAYVVGQLVAAVSSLLLERLMVGRLLGHPRDVLFARYRAWAWVRRLLPAYFEPLPQATRDAIRAKANSAQGEGDALFWRAYVAARENSAAVSRLENFLNLYGFCRNIALVALADACIWYWSYQRPNGPDEHLLWARLSLLVAAGMTLRYLKFIRIYATEVFTTYAYSREEAQK